MPKERGFSFLTKMSQQDVGKPGRIRGFESPLSRNQKASWIGNVVATGGFYVVCGVASCEDTFIALGVHLIFVILGASCWIFLETHDPTQESCFSKLLPDSERWTKVRYSREHKKVVAGLDHYCTWLNVAVCRSNYLPFYLLSLFGTAQYALHVVIMIIILTSCDAGSQQIGLVFFAAAWLVLGALLLFPYASLASFHTFLCYHRMGMYLSESIFEYIMPYLCPQEPTIGSCNKDKPKPSSSRALLLLVPTTTTTLRRFAVAFDANLPRNMPENSRAHSWLRRHPIPN